MLCPKCNSLMPDEYKFCSACGEVLKKQQTPQDEIPSEEITVTVETEETPVAVETEANEIMQTEQEAEPILSVQTDEKKKKGKAGMIALILGGVGALCPIVAFVLDLVSLIPMFGGLLCMIFAVIATGGGMLCSVVGLIMGMVIKKSGGSIVGIILSVLGLILGTINIISSVFVGLIVGVIGLAAAIFGICVMLFGL